MQDEDSTQALQLGVVYLFYLALYMFLCTESCLKGFSDEIPPKEEWRNFSTTVFDAGADDDRTYLFPSLRFTCDGMLQELSFPIELRGSASRYWDDILNICITVWRPSGRTGYDEIDEIRYLQVITETESMISLERTEVLQFIVNMTIERPIWIQTNDIIALTYAGRVSRDGVDVANHFPFLLREDPTSIILDTQPDPGFMPLGSNFFLPIIMANFTPASALSKYTACSIFN